MVSEPGERRRDWLERSRLYLISDTTPKDRPLDELLRLALQGGVDVVQLRDKSADANDIVRAGRTFRRLCDAYEALFIVNDRPDLAIACGADGVHLGQADADVGDVRRLVGDDMLIGRSTHSREQIERACGAGADYLAVGPVYATPTKPDYEPVGLELIAFAAANASLPFFAIGGIEPANAATVIAAGATRLAVVRAIVHADDPAAAAQGLVAAIGPGAGVEA
jgi:thiamine-phosphate pyrophosphorylase